MLMLLNKNSQMGSPLFHEFKRQASFFFKEKIKTARLALTDITPAELLTEEATNEDTWPPDTRAMAVISRSAFEVDDYWRIVDILHKRLMKFDRKSWRGAYKALLVLEHLLTHGPLRVSDEFESNREAIMEMRSFQFVDEKGTNFFFLCACRFNWGASVRSLSERILKLLENGLFLKEERARARKLTRGIQGFGSFSQQSLSHDVSYKSSAFRTWASCNSNYNDHHHSQENEFTTLHEKLLMTEETSQEESNEDISSALGDPAMIRGKEYTVRDHPFCRNDHLTTASLLSAP